MLLILESLLWEASPPGPNYVIYPWMFDMPDTEMVDVVGNPTYPDPVRQGAANIIDGRVILYSFWSEQAQLLRLIATRAAYDEAFVYFIDNAVPIFPQPPTPRSLG